MREKTPIIVLTCLLTALPAAAEDVLVKIDHLEPSEIAVRGFELYEPQRVRVEAKGLELRGRHEKKTALTAAWILDAESRETVWSLADSKPSGGRSGLPEHAADLRLGAGVYEAYYATFPVKHSYQEHDSWWESTCRKLAQMLGWGEDERALEEALGDLGLVVRGRGRPLDESEVADLRGRRREDLLVSFAAGENDFAEESGFILERPLELEVYAVGELEKDDGWDYGWIVDTKTRKRVWTFTYADSEPAGGTDKNRRIRKKLRLPAGEYAAFFVTDGSHSPGSWNHLPPQDPDYWGMTLRVREPQARQYARASEYRYLPDDDRVVVEVTRLRDHESRTRSIHLTRPLDLRVYALGEGYPGYMADYGWIIDARTREKVWKMDFRRTQHAGGGSKNRVADEIVHLDAGSYLVGFTTDSSHSYPDWNDEPPTYPKRWGITLYGVGESFDPSWVSSYEPHEDPAILARIDRVRSGSHRRKAFSLDHKAQVRVYALGEGMHGEMYDYGWLEEAGSGRVVWKMDFPKTADAGGDSKNRSYFGTLDLEAGDYTLHYRTDGTHAYREWNTSPPDDPDSWGVQVALMDRRE